MPRSVQTIARMLALLVVTGLLFAAGASTAFAQAGESAAPGTESPATESPATESPATEVPVAAAFDGVQSSGGGPLEAIMFYLVAALVLGSGLAICITGNVVRMAVYLFFTLGSVAVLYFLLMANFIAVIQLIVYAGGTLILLIFGVMLTSKSPFVRFDVPRGELVIAGLICAVFAGVLLKVVSAAGWPVTDAPVAGQPVAAIGTSLVTDYLVPFEAVSVLLLVVMIGAALLARQEES